MLKKEWRITKKKEFDLIFQSGRSSYSQILGVKSILNGLTFNRFGVIVSNKVSKRATERNSIKRKIRAQLFILNNSLKQGFDVLILVQPKQSNITSETIQNELAALFKKLRLANE